MIKVSIDSPEAPSFQAHVATWVIHTFDSLHKLMGLGDWIIKISWSPVDGNKVMATTAEPEYYQAEVDIDLPDVDEYLRDYVRHELLHVILWRYTDTAERLSLKKARGVIRKLEETVVSDLERMPLWDLVSTPPA